MFYTLYIKSNYHASTDTMPNVSFSTIFFMFSLRKIWNFFCKFFYTLGVDFSNFSNFLFEILILKILKEKTLTISLWQSEH